MNVSPLDLRQQKFSRELRGFDTTEVTAFLVAAADEADRPPRHAARGGHQLDERVVRRARHGWSGHADEEGIVADAGDFGLA